MLFPDRTGAGKHLAAELVARLPHLRERHPIVLAIPRGGVIVGREVARVLDAPLDVIVARKLGAPGHEELGIGAITSVGAPVLDADIIASLGVDEAYLDAVMRKERSELERRVRVFRGARPPPALAGRAVVIVDDGLATGVTARAALAAVRRERPSQLVFAAPVCSVDGRAALLAEGYDVVCLAAPEDFRGVGEWYAEFEQVTDAEVMDALSAEGRGKGEEGSGGGRGGVKAGESDSGG